MLALTTLGGMLGESPLPPARSLSFPAAAIAEVRVRPALVVDGSERTDWPARIEARLAELVRARASVPPPEVVPSPLHARLEALAQRGSVHAELGISIRDLTTGTELFGWESARDLNPASNHKLLTATAAIELLGPDFRFRTVLSREGDTLYLVGGGDPSLQVPHLEALAAGLDAEALVGVRRIVVDDSMFSPERYGPGYDAHGPGYSFMAPSGALSLQWNTVEITVQPRSTGAGADVRLEPTCDHLVLETNAGRRKLSITTREHGSRTLVAVHGQLPRSAEPVHMRRRVSDPGLFTGSVLARILARTHAGAVLPVERGHAPARARTLAVHRSAPLSIVLRSALRYSNNFTTEQILRTLGHMDSGRPGDWDNGRAVVERFWSAIGEDPAALVFENASGLSRRGRVSARALAALVQLWADREHAAGRIIDAMPKAGRDGTLRARLQQSQGRVRAKTGTLAGASALTGFVADEAGHPRLGFSILVNGNIGVRQAERLQDEIVMALVHS